MIGKPLLVALAAILAVPAAADGEGGTFVFGGDSYLAGRAVSVTGAVPGALFAVGGRVGVDAPVAGSAHLAGRRVAVREEVSGDLYAMGYRISVEAPVGRDASLTGAEIALSAPVSGNLRAAGAEIVISDTIGGAALLTGSSIELDGAISGDAVIAADELHFGPHARVGGRLSIATDDPEEVDVPSGVADPARVEITRLRRGDLDVPDEISAAGRRTFLSILANLLVTAVLVGIVAAVAVAVAPGSVARVRRAALARPLRAILAGFVTLSALVGSGIVLALTLVGLFLTPAAILVSVLAVLAGYVAGAYILGIGLWSALGKPIPEELPRRAGLGALGALVAGLVAMIPVIGWIAWMVLVFLGLGGIAAVSLGAERDTAANG